MVISMVNISVRTHTMLQLPENDPNTGCAVVSLRFIHERNPHENCQDLYGHPKLRIKDNINGHVTSVFTHYPELTQVCFL